jgi:hypothetical protein
MRIFLKLFLASQGFVENKICHAMNATIGQIKLRKHFLYVKFSKNADYCTSTLAKFYYVKSGYYRPTPPLNRNLTPEIRMHWERALGNLICVLLHAPR